MNIRKLNNTVLSMWVKTSIAISSVLALPTRLLAKDANPWSAGTAVTPDQIESTTGMHMGKDLSMGLIGGGVLLLSMAVGLLISVLNQDAEDKRNDGAFKTIMKIVIMVVCISVGLVIIGLGFSGIKALEGNQ